MVLGTLLVWLLRLDRLGVAVVGSIPRGLPSFAPPELELSTMRALLPTAVTLALVQFMNVITLGKVFAARYRYSVRPNRELLAIGAANLVGSFFFRACLFPEAFRARPSTPGPVPARP